jgi:hypothetical protein
MWNEDFMQDLPKKMVMIVPPGLYVPFLELNIEKCTSTSRAVTLTTSVLDLETSRGELMYSTLTSILVGLSSKGYFWHCNRNYINEFDAIVRELRLNGRREI